MIDKPEEKKMTEKMMIKKTGLALLGLVIGMAFMGASSVTTSAKGGCQKGTTTKQACEQCCKGRGKDQPGSKCMQKCQHKQ